MHRKQNTDLIPADTELEKTLRSLRKIKKAETPPWQMKGKNRMMSIEKQSEDLQSQIQWKTSGDQLSRLNTLRSDNLQLRPIISN